MKKNVLKMSDDEFYALFNGKDVMDSKTVTYKKAIDYLREDTTHMKRNISACIVFFMKPKDYLLYGKTKTGKGDGKGVSNWILAILPRHDTNIIDQMKSEIKLITDETLKAQKERELKSRESLPEVARNVNFTQIKNVVLLTLETLYAISAFSDDEFKKNPSNRFLVVMHAYLGGIRPSNFSKSERCVLEHFGGNEQSYHITKQKFEDFAGDESYWFHFMMDLKDLFKVMFI
jgi:hypothetical protein